MKHLFLDVKASRNDHFERDALKLAQRLRRHVARRRWLRKMQPPSEETFAGVEGPFIWEGIRVFAQYRIQYDDFRLRADVYVDVP